MLIKMEDLDSMDFSEVSISLCGRVGQPAKIAMSQSSGKEYLQFSVAVNRYKPSDGSTITTWYTVRSWQQHTMKRFTETLDHNGKGCLVYISGTLSAGLYYKKDGDAALDLSVFAKTIFIVNKPKAEETPSQHDSAMDYMRVQAKRDVLPGVAPMPAEPKVQTNAQPEHDSATFNGDDIPF